MPTSKKLFDSSEIPEEIIDMVVVAKDSLNKEGGNRFARCILDTFYAINERMSKPETADKTLVAIGDKFSSLKLEDMKIVVQQTRFYKTPSEALELFKGEQFRSTTMPTVASFCVEHGIVKAKPTIAFEAGNAQLTFDLSHLQSLVDGKNP
jgi:NitT/TauT family transport system substrate-binding protein